MMYLPYEELINRRSEYHNDVTSVVIQEWEKRQSTSDDVNDHNDDKDGSTCTSSRKQIIHISSRAGKKGIPSMGFYVSSKFALEGYSATLAEELKDDFITVNTISPCMVNTKAFPKDPNRQGVRTA